MIWLQRFFGLNVAGAVLPGSLLLAGSALVFIPAILFDGNRPYFSVSLVALLMVLLPVAIGAAGLLTLPALGQVKPWKQRYAGALAGIGVAAWANATFVSSTQGALDGVSFALDARPFLLVLHSAGFVLLAAVVYFLFQKKAKQTQRFVLLLAGLLLVNTGWIAFRPHSNPEAQDAESRLLRFSSETNVLLVLMDTFQADLFSAILEANPDLAKQLQGFTFYPRTAGVAPTTRLAMPTIHSGRNFRPGDSLPHFYETGVAKGSFLSALAARGYESFQMTPMMGICPAGTICADESDIVQGLAKSRLHMAAQLVDLALLRMAPAVLKPLVYDDGAWLISGLRLFAQNRAELSNGVLEAIATRMTTDSPRPTVKFIHLFNSHPPARLNAQCVRLRQANWNRRNAIAQNTCAVNHFIKLLAGLRQRNLYDRTAVVWFADHGARLPPPGGHSMGAGASPLLLVKPLQARGPLKISQANASLTDIAPTVCAMTGACEWSDGQNVLALKEGQPRTRYFIPYEWRSNSWTAESFPIDGRFRLSGDPAQIASWDRVPYRETPPTRKLEFDTSDPTELFGPGWLRPSRGGGQSTVRWTAGSRALLWLIPPSGAKGVVRATVRTHAGNPQQVMEVFATGVPVYRGGVTSEGSTTVSFTLPKGVPGSEGHRLEFRFSQYAFTPNEPPHGKSNELAVAFDHIVIE